MVVPRHTFYFEVDIDHKPIRLGVSRKSSRNIPPSTRLTYLRSSVWLTPTCPKGLPLAKSVNVLCRGYGTGNLGNGNYRMRYGRQDKGISPTIRAF